MNCVRFRFFAASILMTAQLGCVGIKGTWRVEDVQPPEAKHQHHLVEVTFHDDMTFDATAEEVGKPISSRGTYLFNEWTKQLTLKASGVERTYTAEVQMDRQLTIAREWKDGKTMTVTMYRKGPCPYCADCAFCRKEGDTPR